MNTFLNYVFLLMIESEHKNCRNTNLDLVIDVSNAQALMYDMRLIGVSWRHGNKLYVISESLCVTYVYNLSLSKCYNNFCAQI